MYLKNLTSSEIVLSGVLIGDNMLTLAPNQVLEMSDAILVENAEYIVNSSYKHRVEAFDMVKATKSNSAGEIEVPFVVASRTAVQLASAPTATDKALGISTIFFDKEEMSVTI